jgi:hypothetical protein
VLFFEGLRSDRQLLGVAADRRVEIGNPLSDEGEIERGFQEAVEVISRDKRFECDHNSSFKRTDLGWTNHSGEAFSLDGEINDS